MEITSQIVDSISVVSITGSIDALTSGQMDSYLRELVGQGQSRFLLDLGGVEFMSSAGLRSVLTGMKEARQRGGDVRLAAAQPGVENILKLSGFTNILKSYISLDQAMEDYTDRAEGREQTQGEMGNNQHVIGPESGEHV